MTLSSAHVIAFGVVFGIGAIVFLRPWTGPALLAFAGALGPIARVPELKWDLSEVIAYATAWSGLLYLLFLHRGYRRSAIDAPILMLAAAVVFNLGRAANQDAFNSNVRFVALLFLCILAVQLFDTTQKVRWALMAVVVAGSVVAVMSMMWGSAALLWRTRLGGPFEQPNALAQITAIATPLGLGMAFSASGARRYLFGILASVNALCTLLTQSRAAIIGITLGCGLVLYAGRKGLRRGVAVALAVVLVGYVVSSYIALPGQVFSRFERAPLSGEMRKDTGLTRRRIFAASLEAFFDKPLGRGVGTDVSAVGRILGLPRGSHNTLLRLAVELGVPGLVAGAWLIAVQLLSCWRVARFSEDPLFATLGSSCLGALLANWCHNMFHDTVHSGFVWVFFAAAASLCVHAVPTRRLTPAPPVATWASVDAYAALRR